MECFWTKCSDRKRCEAHGSCVAKAQAGGATFKKVLCPPADVESQSDRAAQQLAWLRWGLEEIVRCTEPRAGSGDTWIMKIADDALSSAGFPITGAGIQKPSEPVRS